MKGIKTYLLAAAMMLIGAAVLTGCGNEGQKDETVLKVGTNATYLPFEFKGEDGSYQGYDMDLARAIGKELGMKVEIHNISFDGLLNALGSGQINMIASGMSITEEREKKVNFIPYYESGQGIMVANGQKDSIKTPADLEGKKIAVQLASTGAEQAHKIPNAAVTEFNHNSEAFLELKQGGADAVIADLPVIQYYLATTNDSGAVMLDAVLDKSPMGLAFNKEDKALYENVQKALQSLKEKGELQKIHDKWFKAEK